ncbi:MAG: DUF481 domain-containing protein [Bacteroidota bacterium]
MIFCLLRKLLPCLFLILNLQLAAQIVNIEDRRGRPDSLGWRGQVDLAGQLTENSNRVLTLKGGIRLDQLGERTHGLFLANYQLIQAGADNLINDGFFHFRYGYDLNERLRWEAFTQLQYNERLRLSARWLIGTGPRIALLSPKPGRRLNVGILYMFEYDEFDASDISYRDHRLSTYISARFPLTEQLVFTNTTYYQPLLFSFEVPRLSMVSNLEFTISSWLSFTSNLNFTHDGRLGRDFPEVPETVYSWLNGFRFRF